MSGVANPPSDQKPGESCGTCRFFVPRDPEAPWPIAGVTPAAEGRCTVPRMESGFTRWTYRHLWCDRFAARAPETPSAPSAAQPTAQPEDAAPERTPLVLSISERTPSTLARTLARRFRWWLSERLRPRDPH